MRPAGDDQRPRLPFPPKSALPRIRVRHGSASSLILIAVFAVCLVAFLVWQTSAAQKTVTSIDSDDPSPARSVEVRPPLTGAVEKPVQRLVELAELRSAAKGTIVNAVGLVVDIVDRPGVPFRATIADNTGVAEVVCFTPSDELRARIRASECLRLDARVDTYRGGFQLEPVAFSLVSGGSAAEMNFPPRLHPSAVTRYSDLREGTVVAVEAKVLSATPTRSEGGMHGELALAGGDRVRYLWSDPPPELSRAQGMRGFARVGSYEQRLQLRPFTVTAKLMLDEPTHGQPDATPSMVGEPQSEKSPEPIVKVMQGNEGGIVRVRGIVADVVESEKLPFMVALADSTASVKVVIGDAREEIRARLRAAAKAGEVLSLEARINAYRGEKQLQPVDRAKFEYLAGTSVPAPETLERLAQLKLGLMFRVTGVIEHSKLNRAGGLNGGVRIPSGDVIDFIWWSPPPWAREGARVSGFARVGEFRGLQLEFTSSIQSTER